MIVVDSAAVVDALTAVAGTDELRARLAGHLSATRAEDLLTDFDDLPMQRWPSADALRRRAFQLRDNVSAYDAAYVALAEALDCPLVTRDGRLARSRGHSAQIEVR